VRPRLQSGSLARPLNFTVRRIHRDAPWPAPSENCRSGGACICRMVRPLGLLFCRPRLRSLPRHLLAVRPNGPLSSASFGDVTVRCIAAGGPRPLIDWSHCEAVLDSSPRCIRLTIVGATGCLRGRAMHAETLCAHRARSSHERGRSTSPLEVRTRIWWLKSWDRRRSAQLAIKRTQGRCGWLR